jgi:hypothetical protein
MIQGCFIATERSYSEGIRFLQRRDLTITAAAYPHRAGLSGQPEIAAAVASVLARSVRGIQSGVFKYKKEELRNPLKSPDPKRQNQSVSRHNRSLIY